MSSRTKIIIISAAAGAAAVGAGIFGVYKYFVTPDRVVLLSMLNTREELDSAFEYIDKTDSELIKHYSDEGGKLTLNLSAAEESVFAGMPVNIIVNSDGRCSVSEIDLYDRFKFETYKDSEQLLISTPLFNGGFRLPVNNFTKEWNGSIFGSVFQLPESGAAAEILRGFLTGDYGLSGFIESKNAEIKAAAQTVEINKAGRANVTIDNKTRGADVYKMHLSMEFCDDVLSLLSEYICSTPAGAEKVKAIAAESGISEAEAADDIKNSLSVLSGEYDITLKVNDLKLRELDVCRDGGDTYTVSLRGGSNIFSDIIVYKNGDVQNALRRVVTGANGNFNDSVSIGNATVLTIESDSNSFGIRYNMDDIVLDVSAYGKMGTDTSVSFSNVDININDTVRLIGSAELTEEYDSDFGFSKSGEYVDLLKITTEDWEAVSGTILAALGLLSANGS